MRRWKIRLSGIRVNSRYFPRRPTAVMVCPITLLWNSSGEGVASVRSQNSRTPSMRRLRIDGQPKPPWRSPFAIVSTSGNSGIGYQSLLPAFPFWSQDAHHSETPLRTSGSLIQATKRGKSARSGARNWMRSPYIMVGLRGQAYELPGGGKSAAHSNLQGCVGKVYLVSSLAIGPPAFP